MANSEHIEILKRGSKAWNVWREDNPQLLIDLEATDLSGAYFVGAKLSGANLWQTYLRGANLEGANLEGANLRGADLSEANLTGANLRGANLEGANLEGANLEGANLEGANLRELILPNGIAWTPATDMSIFNWKYYSFTEPEELFGPVDISALVKAEKQNETVVQFSAFYPGTVVLGGAYSLLVSSHLEAFAEKVRSIAAGYSNLMGEKPTDGFAQSLKSIKTGSLLTFVPFIRGVMFTPTEQLLVWQPPYQNASFLFQVPHGMSTGLITGSIRVYQGPLIVGEIPITMELVTAIKPREFSLDHEAKLNLFDPIFASYSHKDTAVMEYFRRQRASIGQKMLVDIYDLKSGEYWSNRLFEMIDESAAFQLFWSKNSSQSEYCRSEWKYALKYKDHRPRFIQPVWWKAPMPQPPEELADFHFQRIRLFIRPRIKVAEVRRLFKRN